MKIVSAAALLLAAVLAAGCDAGQPATPQPGELVITLATPNPADGAMLVTITGPDAVAAVQPAANGVVRTRIQGATTTVAVFGTLADGPLLRISVPDVRQAKRYAATVREAADSGNRLRASLAGYALTVSR